MGAPQIPRTRDRADPAVRQDWFPEVGKAMGRELLQQFGGEPTAAKAYGCLVPVSPIMSAAR